MRSFLISRILLLWIFSSFFGLLSGCLSTAPQQQSDTSKRLSFEEAVTEVVNSTNAQLQNQSGLLGKIATAAGQIAAKTGVSGPRIVVLDPMLDGNSGQLTALSGDFERRVLAKLAADKSRTILPISSESIVKSDTLLIGTVAVDSGKSTGGRTTGNVAVLHLAYVDLKSGNVLAQATARARGNTFDITPSKFDQDSPIVMYGDLSTAGYIRTASQLSGQPADSNYLKQLNTSALVTKATQAYNSGKYGEALRFFQSADSGQPDGGLKALNGAYLANVQLGKLDQAEQIFSKIATISIRNRDMGVKFLFGAGSSDFLTDPKISGMYDVWIRQIARALGQTPVCVELVGHASKTGAEAYNERLSDQRAERIKARLLGESDRLKTRISASGAGSKEPIIGTGTDDMSDAVDRRVVFKFHECKV